jgi:2'-5' RNA ligase
MIDILHTTKWGSFALVSYIPDPLGSFLHNLRRSFPGEHNPQPHITLLPPRPLKLPVDAASQKAHNTLLQFAAFEVELSKVRSFPETNVLYLDIAKGNRVLRDLHQALNAGDLDHTEEFEFRPHLTLSGRVESAHLPWVRREAETAWYSSDHPRRFTLDEVIFLWLSPESRQCEWHRVSSRRLNGREDASRRAAIAGARNRT